MPFQPPEAEWLPLHEGILKLGSNPDHVIETICERVSSAYPPVMLEYDIEDSTFFVSLARDRESSSPYQFVIGSFRLADKNFRFGDIADQATAAESGLVNEAVARFFTLLRIRLRVGFGRDFVVYARAGSPLAEQFSSIPEDVLQHFEIKDWQRGVAAADNGDLLFSIYLAPPPTGDALRGNPNPLHGKSKAAEVARFIKEVYNSKRPSITMGKLQQEFLKWKNDPHAAKAPDRDTMNKGISIAEQAAREGWEE